MNYGKSGNPKTGKKSPLHKEHNAPGSDKNPFGASKDKSDLLARMKASAEARKKPE